MVIGINWLESTKMSYSIVFTGELKATVSRDQAILNLAQMFKKDTAAIEKLFTGKKIVIKRNLDQQSASKYQMALANAGVVSELIEEKSDISSRQNAAVQAPMNKALTMADVGVTIIDNIEPPEPMINISSLSISETGSTLVEADIVTAANIELPSYGIAPTGATLNEDKAAEQPSIDTSSLSLAEKGDRILTNNK